MSSPIPPDCVSLADYQRHAASRLDPAARAYLDGAAADGRTHAANLADWSAEPLFPRVLIRPAQPSLGLELFGQTLPMPILVAPTAYHRLFHPDGERATAQAAAALGAGLVISTQASLPLAEITAAAGPAPCWFQLYLQPTREATLQLVRLAEAAGCRALVVTVDAPVNGIRNDEQRAGFTLPRGIRAVALDALPPPPSIRSALDPAFTATLPTWDDLAWLRNQTRLPLLPKGILHPDDAHRAVDLGADGVIVSNHGGRTLDTLPSTCRALPAVAEAVAGRVPVLVDGGIRRGTDVVRALALGARAVLVGRPVLHGLAIAGAAGAAHVLALLRHETEVALLLSGRG